MNLYLNNKISSFKKNQILVLIFTYILPNYLFSQFAIGSSIGFQIPGSQDLKFRNYNEHGELVKNLRTTYVKSTSTVIINFHSTYWYKKIGIRFEYLSWENSSTAKAFRTEEKPSFSTVEQSREAIYLDALMRIHFPFKKQKNDILFQKSYSFFGLGYGQALTEVQYGLQHDIKPGLQATYGICIPIIKNLKTIVEFKYLLTHDADNIPVSPGITVVDTSGRWFLIRPGPHLDTRFFSFQLGIQYDLFK